MRAWQWRLIGVLTLGGSFLGAVASLMIIINGGNNLLSLLIVAVFIGLYAWGVWCGVRILERSVDSLRRGILFWAFQIPYLTSPLLSYQFSSGAQATVAVQSADPALLWTVQVGSHFAATVLRPAAWGIGINLLALAATIFLSLKYRSLSRRENMVETELAPAEPEAAAS